MAAILADRRALVAGRYLARVRLTPLDGLDRHIVRSTYRWMRRDGVTRAAARLYVTALLPLDGRERLVRR